MPFKNPLQLIRSTPFAKGYSDQARTQADFGDWDNLDENVAAEQGIKTGADLESYMKDQSPLERLRFKSPLSLGNAFQGDDSFELNEEIDEDYERAYGPVTNEKQYQAYLKWKAMGN